MVIPLTDFLALKSTNVKGEEMLVVLLFSIIDSLIVSSILIFYTVLSKRTEVKNLDFFVEKGKGASEEQRKDSKEELTKRQLKWTCIMLPTLLLAIYGLFLLGFPIIFFFFGMFYLAYVVSLPTLVFSTDLSLKKKYLFTFVPLTFPITYFLASVLTVPSFVTIFLYNLVTVTLCFAIVMNAFNTVEIDDKFFLIFFTAIFVYDIIAVGSGVLVNIVREIGSEAQGGRSWLFPPIFLILPGKAGPVYLGLGDIFLLGFVFIRVRSLRNLVFLLSVISPFIAFTFLIVSLFQIPLPASFLGFAAWIVLRLLRKGGRRHKKGR